MKRCLGLLGTLLLLPLLASCGLFGDSEQERYEREMELYQQQLEAYQKWQEEYYKNLEQAINEYNKAYADWQKQEMERALQQAYGENQTVVVVVSGNQTQQ
ncbi:MAG: hypothetical protein N2506_02040 [Dehalococcoidales bacterium]|nr:hypothetical protein [Dehalococcoidales bacterium]